MKCHIMTTDEHLMEDVFNPVIPGLESLIATQLKLFNSPIFTAKVLCNSIEIK